MIWGEKQAWGAGGGKFSEVSWAVSLHTEALMPARKRRWDKPLTEHTGGKRSEEMGYLAAEGLDQKQIDV